MAPVRCSPLNRLHRILPARADGTRCISMSTDPRTMDELLARVLDAHGGLERWSSLEALTARLSVGGPFWGLRGFPDAFLVLLRYGVIKASWSVWVVSPQVLDSAWCAQLSGGADRVSIGVVFFTVQELM